MSKKLKARPALDRSINSDTVKISVRLMRAVHAEAKARAMKEGTDLMRWVEALVISALAQRAA